MGPFPKAVRNKKYLLVGTDYFTKWVETDSLANIRDVDAKKFVWKNIVTRFGVPHTIISDNGLQFDKENLSCFSLPSHTLIIYLKSGTSFFGTLQHQTKLHKFSLIWVLYKKSYWQNSNVVSPCVTSKAIFFFSLS